LTGKFLPFFPSISQSYGDKVPAGGTIIASRPWEACEIIMRSIIVYVMAQMRRMQSDRRGAVAVVIALLAIPVLAGFAAMAVDTSTWSSAQNSAQGAADNAALSALVAAGAGASSTQVTNEALANAALNGFTNGQNGVTVTVNNPPKSGPNTSNSSAYEVIVTKPQKTLFGGLLGTAPTVIGRAVALNPSPACLLALNTSASSAFALSGGSTTVTASNCTVAANSSSASAVTLSGGASITAGKLNVVGNYTTSGGSTVTATIKTGAPATSDPYASLAVPSFSGCGSNPTTTGGSPTTYTPSGSPTINPGVYCGGINVSGGANLTMNSGTYIINGSGPGNFAFNVSGSTVTGSGVSIVVTGPGTGGWGTVNISGSTVTLSAPASGAMQGVVMYMDRKAPGPLTTGCNNNQCTDNISGGSSMSITGTLYFPSQIVNYSGGGSGSACEQLIADEITFSGGASFGKSCGSLTVPGLSGGTQGIPAE
jgi:Flp pilus assembly protein TadG